MPTAKEDIIAEIEHELAVVKSRPPYDGGEFNLLAAMENAKAQGEQMALTKLLLWIRTQEARRA